MRWPFVHIGSPQNWEVRHREDLAMLLAVDHDGHSVWINHRARAEYEQNGWTCRFNRAGALVIAELNNGSMWYTPTKELGALIVSVATWLLAFIIVGLFFLVLGNSG
jgi:hypothetical protein